MTIVRRADARDADAAVRILADAFSDDPVCCWLFPDRARRQSAHPKFFQIFVHSVLTAGRLELADEVGVALWQPIPASADLAVDVDLFIEAFAPVCGEDAA